MVRLAERITRKDIQRIASGDASPFTRIRDYIYKTIIFQTRGADDATSQDLTQETLLYIFQHAKEYNPQYAPSTFIGLMIRRSVQGWRQSAWRRRVYSNQDNPRDENENRVREIYDRVNGYHRGSPIDDLIERERLGEERERAESLRNSLGENNYTMLHEHYGLDVPQPSIAVARNMPLNTIKSRFHRIKTKARRNLGKVA